MIEEVWVGSKNKAKIKAVKSVFPEEVQIIAQDAPSSVSSQPQSDEETRQGAINRAKHLVEYYGASIAIGLEGGVIDGECGMQLCNWGALVTEYGEVFTAGGARIFLPEKLAQGIKSGKELGEVIDQFANKDKVREGLGTIGVLTVGEVTRDQMFSHVVKLLYGQWKYHNE